MQARRATTAVYTYNPDCGCSWCARGGAIPTGTPSNGHSFGFERPHLPPTRSPWTSR